MCGVAPLGLAQRKGFETLPRLGVALLEAAWGSAERAEEPQTSVDFLSCTLWQSL